MEENYGHKPVLLHECLGALAIKPDGIYVDGTLGRAGHSLEIVRRLTTGRLIALDRDETAIEAANRRLGDYLDKVTLVHSNFSALDAVLHELGVHGVDGMLFDLGVSSPQLDEAQRGFSYKQDAPLDMRMDESAALTAREVVNTYSYEELRRILFEYGEERYAPAIAKRICQHREQKPIETTLELADIIRSAMPASALREKQHPAKRGFQAIRIAVNDELGELPPMLDAAEKNLKPGGRLAVITFHSLEDRIVKKKLQELAQGCGTKTTSRPLRTSTASLLKHPFMPPVANHTKSDMKCVAMMAVFSLSTMAIVLVVVLSVNRCSPKKHCRSVKSGSFSSECTQVTRLCGSLIR